jgi:hypothetical protein
MKYFRVIIIAFMLLGYIVSYFFYEKGIFTQRHFLFLSLMAILAFFTLVYLSKTPTNNIDITKLNINIFFLILLAYLIFASTFSELLFQGYSGLLTIFSLVLTLLLLIFSKDVFLNTITATTILASFIVAVYRFYVPNFGVDTWRDSTQAIQIVEKGGLSELTIIHDAFPIPLVSILYAVIAMITGLDSLCASSLMGLLYIYLLSFWIFIIAKSMEIPYPHLSVLLVFTIPHVIMWSSAFIPQAYSVLSAVPLLFLDLKFVAVLLFSISTVMGHGGLALWMLIFFVSFFFFQFSFRKHIKITRSMKMKIVFYILSFTIYVTYLIIAPLLRGSSLIINVLYNFLAGSLTPLSVSTTTTTANLWNLIIDLSPYIILLLLGFIVVIVEEADHTLLSYAFVGMAGLSIAIFVQTYVSGLDAMRYVGMQSSIVLAIIAPKSLFALTSRGRAGIVYALAILFLAIISFGFEGVLMPENPYVSTFHTGTFSSGSLKWVEVYELSNLASLLTNDVEYITDVKAGLYLGYNYIWIKFESRGIFLPEKGIRFLLGGFYFTITPDYLERFHGMLLFREGGLRIMKAYSPDILSYIEGAKCQQSLIYNGKNVEFMYFSNK